MKIIMELAAALVVGYFLVGADLALIEWVAEMKIRERKTLARKQRMAEPLRELSKVSVYKDRMYIQQPSAKV